jgi:hypothetical protein
MYKKDSKFKEIQSVIIAFYSIVLISFIGGVIYAYIVGHHLTAFLVLPTFIWMLPLGVFILPSLGLINGITTIIRNKEKTKSSIILIIISVLLLISPYFYSPAISIKDDSDTVTTVTDSLAPTNNYFKRVAQYERMLLENGCRIDLLSWSVDSVNLLFDVAPKGNCPYEGLYTWNDSSKTLQEGNPNQLPIDIIAPWINDNPDSERISNILPDFGYYIVDVLPAPDGKKYALTSDWFYNEDVFIATISKLTDDEVNMIIDQLLNQDMKEFCALTFSERQMIVKIIIDRNIYPDFDKFPVDKIYPVTPEEEVCGF